MTKKHANDIIVSSPQRTEDEHRVIATGQYDPVTATGGHQRALSVRGGESGTGYLSHFGSL